MAKPLNQSECRIEGIVKAVIAVLEKICPLISPANGAPVSAIFVLIREWPVRRISGLPPNSAILSNRTWLAFRVGNDCCSGISFSTSSASTVNS